MESITMERRKARCAEILKEAQRINQYAGRLPELEVGGVYLLAEIWDGDGEPPCGSYSYHLGDLTWINYKFTVISADANPLKTVVFLSDIELL